jgi:hypothetical protein
VHACVWMRACVLHMSIELYARKVHFEACVRAHTHPSTRGSYTHIHTQVVISGPFLKFLLHNHSVNIK